MKILFKAIADWIARADAGDVTSVLFVGGMMLGGCLIALAAVIHGFN